MSTKKKNLGILAYVLIAVVALGIGYAAISAVTLTISGRASATANQNNFVVVFNDAANKTSITSNPASIATYNDGTEVTTASVDATDKTVASFSLYGFTNKNQYADVTYTVINNSPDLKAKLCENSITVTGGSASTFTSTASLPSATGDPKCVILNANGGETTIVVRTTLNVTPTTQNVSANDLQVRFQAEPIANN